MTIEQLQNKYDMDYEFAYMLHVIGNYINGKESPAPSNIDWNKLYEYSDLHRMQSIIFIQCKSYMPKDVFAKFRVRDLHIKTNYQKVRNKFENITNLFIDNNIDFIPLKGLRISQYYPDPYARYIVDLDIFVVNRQLELVNELLTPLGYKRVNLNPEHHYIAKDFCIEIHPEITYNAKSCNKMEYKLFNDFDNHLVDNDDGKFKRLDLNFEFVYLLWHLNKHLICDSIRLKMIIDMCMLYKHANLDFNAVNEFLNTSSLTKFANIIYSLANDWFDVSFEKLLDKSITIKDTTLFTITKSVLNHFTQEYIPNTRSEAYDVYLSNKKFSKFTTFRWKLFPSQEVLLKDHRYKFVQKSKLLVPIAWVYRLYCAIRYEHVLKPDNFSRYTTELTDRINDQYEWHN